MKQAVTVFWFRRDLRLTDNVGFHQALMSDHPVLPIFIFDPEILEQLPPKDARVSFIYETLQRMRKTLQEEHQSSIAIYYDSPARVFHNLLKQYQVKFVFANHDYEPYAQKRDTEISALLIENNIGFKTFKDQVVFEKNEVVKDDGSPYVVYTPYMKKWKAAFAAAQHGRIHDSGQLLPNLIEHRHLPNLSLSDFGFQKSSISIPDYNVSPTLIQRYEDTRNFPAKDGTSHLGPHLRFGTISIRKVVNKAIAAQNELFWNELIWREFFMQILWHFPHTVNRAFKPKYDRIKWRNNEEDFKKWSNGQTGYVLVDAGMRQLNASGYMHNRVRMLTASFLCKHLLIDWRWGEAYFAEKLLDYEMASNVGNWQWAAGSGVDAAPYFRIFNPMTQIKKFDKEQQYIKKWVADHKDGFCTDKIVDHKLARERCLNTYKEALR